MQAQPNFPTSAKEAVSLPAEQLVGLTPLTHINPRVQGEIDLVLKVVPTSIVVARRNQQSEIPLYAVPREYGDERQMDDLQSVYDDADRANFAQRKIQVEALDALVEILKTDLAGTGASVERRKVSSGFRNGKFTDTLFIVLQKPGAT
jgi:hypothetical protein